MCDSQSEERGREARTRVRVGGGGGRRRMRRDAEEKAGLWLWCTVSDKQYMTSEMKTLDPFDLKNNNNKPSNNVFLWVFLLDQHGERGL